MTLHGIVTFSNAQFYTRTRDDELCCTASCRPWPVTRNEPARGDPRYPRGDPRPRYRSPLPLPLPLAACINSGQNNNNNIIFDYATGVPAGCARAILIPTTPTETARPAPPILSFVWDGLERLGVHNAAVNAMRVVSYARRRFWNEGPLLRVIEGACYPIYYGL